MCPFTSTVGMNGGGHDRALPCKHSQDTRHSGLEHCAKVLTTAITRHLHSPKLPCPTAFAPKDQIAFKLKTKKHHSDRISKIETKVFESFSPVTSSSGRLPRSCRCAPGGALAPGPARCTPSLMAKQSPPLATVGARTVPLFCHHTQRPGGHAGSFHQRNLHR